MNSFAPWWFLTSSGIGLISAGVLILVYPKILVMVISGTIILMGMFLLSLGLSFKKAVNSVMNEATNDSPFSSQNGPSTITVEIPEKTENQ